MANYTITVDDLRGEYWLYQEGDLTVRIGRGLDADGGTVANTRDTFPSHDVSLEQIATILGRFLKSFRSKRVTLHVDGRFALTEEHLRLIDAILREYKRSQPRPEAFTWQR